jgi:hypothetical protein
MGLEGEESAYDKLRGVDTRSLVERLQSHGIRVLGSSIIGLDDHTPENIDAVIDYAVSHATVFHQFMLYTPIPGTPLYEKHRREASLIPEAEFPPADAHGQYRFNYRHPHIRDGKEGEYLLEAFRRDFRVNGPSVLRMIRVLLNGWQMHKDERRERIRKRIAWEAFPLRSMYAGAVWAIRKWFRNDPRLKETAERLLEDINAAFGWKTRIVAPLIGLFAFFSLRREEKRLAGGWTYEPGSFSEKNPAALALGKLPLPGAAPARMPRPVMREEPVASFGK